MSELEFISIDTVRVFDGAEPEPRSPLARALTGRERGVRDLSLAYGKLEVGGRLDGLELPARARLVRITPERGLVLCPPSGTARLRAALRKELRSVSDLTGALAMIEIDSDVVMRRLTDLDLESLPAAGAVAHVPAVVLRERDRFRVLFAQEYADYLAEVVLDTLAGLSRAAGEERG